VGGTKQVFDGKGDVGGCKTLEVRLVFHEEFLPLGFST
jgi:hypothetical protein